MINMYGNKYNYKRLINKEIKKSRKLGVYYNINLSGKDSRWLYRMYTFLCYYNNRLGGFYD